MCSVTLIAIVALSSCLVTILFGFDDSVLIIACIKGIHMSKICFAFQKAGHCNRGSKCKFDHVFSTTKSGGGGGDGGGSSVSGLHHAGAEAAGVAVEDSSNKRVCNRDDIDGSFGAIENFDGSLGEGGGQVVRSTISFCQILGKPIRIFNIRHKRSTPGLAAQHLEGLNLVTRVCKGRLNNGFVKSTEVTFLPPPTDRAEIRGESFTADPGTAGAVTLMLQISLPGLAFFPSSSSSSSSSNGVVQNSSSSVQLSLCGGTNVSTSPPIDHVQLVLLPILRRMGVFSEVQRVVRGYYPKGRGMMRLSISPVVALMPLQLVERGSVIAIRAIIFGNVHTNEKKVVQEQLNSLLLKLCQSLGPNCNMMIDVEEDANFDKNLKKTSIGVFLLATTDSGMLLPADVLQQSQDGPVDVGALVARLSDLIASGACVDEHTADQLVLYMALAAAFPASPIPPPTTAAADVDNNDGGANNVGSSSIDCASTAIDHNLMDDKSVSIISHDSASSVSGGGVDVAAASSAELGLGLGLGKELTMLKSRQSQMLCGPLSTISSQHLETVILVAQRFVGVKITMTTLESGCRLITVSAAHASSSEITDV